MKRLALWLFAGALAALAVSAAPQAPAAPPNRPALFEEIGQIQSSLEQITGLKFRHRVPYAVMDKPGLRRFLESRITETVKPGEIHAEELTLKMLGMVPRDFDLRKTTVDLLTEQAAAFYDYHRKKLFILDPPPAPDAQSGEAVPAGGGDMQRVALAHELAHALADQNFPLDKYIREGLRNDDASAARLAVMEGQASWLMTAYLFQSAGQQHVPPAMMEMMTRAIETGAQQYPVFAQSPLYMRASLVFPYAAGMSFINALYDKLGRDAFSAPFANPPVSTQQIYHPEKYLAHSAPMPPELPVIPHAKEFHTLADGTLGEFDFRVLLQLYADKAEADEQAPRIAGASYRLVEHRKNGNAVLALASKWDSNQAAARWFRDYRRMMRQRGGPGLRVDEESDNAFAGRNEDGWFRAWLDGDTLRSVEGSPERFQPPEAAPVH